MDSAILLSNNLGLMFLPCINKSDDDDDDDDGLITGGAYMVGAYNWGDVYGGGL